MELEREYIVGVKWWERAAVWLIVPDSISPGGPQVFLLTPQNISSLSDLAHHLERIGNIFHLGTIVLELFWRLTIITEPTDCWFYRWNQLKGILDLFWGYFFAASTEQLSCYLASVQNRFDHENAFCFGWKIVAQRPAIFHPSFLLNYCLWHLHPKRFIRALEKRCKLGISLIVDYVTNTPDPNSTFQPFLANNLEVVALGQ